MTASADAEPRVAGAASRPPLLLLGAGGGAVALVLLLLAGAGPAALLPGVLVLQLVLVLGLLALVDAPASAGAFGLAATAAVVADAGLLLADGDVAVLAAVVALGLIGSQVHQLVRPTRARVTESLADTLVALVLVASTACLLALAELPDGRDVLVPVLAAAGAALLAGRLADLVLPRPALALGAVRGWPGLVLALGAGLAAAVATSGGALAGPRAALVGLAAAAVVAAADLAVDLSAAELRAGYRDRRRVAALTPVGLLLPMAALAPVALVAGRLVLP